MFKLFLFVYFLEFGQFDHRLPELTQKEQGDYCEQHDKANPLLCPFSVEGYNQFLFPLSPLMLKF